MDLGLSGKAAIVTGAGKGLGRAIAAMLASEGASVLLADVDVDAAEQSAGAIAQAGGVAEWCHCDVTDPESVEVMTARGADAFGGIDILVNNAGFTRDMRIVKMMDADWDAVVDVVLKGAFLCSRAAVPLMVERGGGRIINISSRAHLGNPGQANYSSAKAGLLGFTRAMSLELGRNFITVNAVAPGIIDTEAVQGLDHYEKIKANAERTVAIPRIGAPNDVASAVVFLASEQASYISGDVLHVTGGRY